MLIDVLVVDSTSTVQSLKSLAEKYSVGQGFKNKQIKLHEFLIAELLKISDQGHDQVDKKNQDEFKLPLGADSSS